MRDFKGMKRQRGRNRSSGGGSTSGGGKPQQNANRAFDSNGPEGVKVRGNPQHVFEKYQQLARDANAAGDRVLGENYLQHAEHYFRLLRAIQPNRPVSEILGRDQFSSGYDIDFEDESGQQAMEMDPGPSEVETRNDGFDRNRGEWQARDRDERPREDRPREDRPRDDRPRDDRARDDRPRDERPRDDRPRDDRPRTDGGGGRDRWRERDNRPRNRDDRPRDDRSQDAPRDDRPRDERTMEERPKDERPKDERPREERPRDERPRQDVGEPRRERADRRDRDERPKREPVPIAAVEARGGHMLRDADGGESHAPAFLQAAPSAPAPDVGAVDAPPKRRRKPKVVDAGSVDEG